MLPFLIPSCAVHGIANTRQSPSARWSPLLRREGWRRWRHQYYQGGEKGQYLSLRGLSRSRSPRKCWGTAGAPAFRCAKGFFFWPPAALPSRTRCRPSWRAPVGTSGASWLSIPSPKRETTDPALRSKIWLSPARDKGTVLFCTELHLRWR